MFNCVLGWSPFDAQILFQCTSLRRGLFPGKNINREEGHFPLRQVCGMHLRSLLALLVILFLSVSFAGPAEDAPETSYDESEPLPFDRIPVVSIAAAQLFESALAVRSRDSKLIRTCCERTEISRSDIRAGLAHPICNSLTTLQQSFRC